MLAHTNGAAASGAAHPPGPSAEALLLQLLERMERLERKLDRLEAVIDQAPGALALLADTRDGLAAEATRSGVDIDERIRLGLALLGCLTEPLSAAALSGLLDQLAWVERLMRQAPGLLAMGADVADELYAAIGRQGVDLEETVRRGLLALRSFLAWSSRPRCRR